MRWPWKRESRAEHRASYTDALVAAFESAAGDGSAASSAATAALETAAGLYGRAFASAQVSGPRADVLTAEVRAELGRRMIRQGEYLALIEVSGGRIGLLDICDYDVRGPAAEPDWSYRLSVAAPSGQLSMVRPGAAVIHARYSRSAREPWRGLGPLQSASSTGTLIGRVEKRLAAEAGGPVGYVLPLPSDSDTTTGEDQDTEGTLKHDIKTLDGKLAIVETAAAGWGEGRMAAPQQDWQPKRIGMDPPQGLAVVREEVAKDVLAACGVPPSLAVANSDGTAQREAWRRFLHGSVQPLARIAEAELSAKLDAPVRFEFGALMASDLTGRARAYQSLVKADMSADEAKRLCGFE